MVVQKNWKKKKVIRLEEVRKAVEKNTIAPQPQAPPQAPPPITGPVPTVQVSSGQAPTGSISQKVEAVSPQVSSALEFDFEYTSQDIYFQLEDVVRQLIKEKKKTLAASTVSPVAVRRAPRTRAQQRKELSPRTKMLIWLLLAVVLIAIYPAYRYYRAYKVKQTMLELKRIKDQRRWRERERLRLMKEQYMKPAREFIKSAQDRLVRAEEEEHEKYSERKFLTGRGYLTKAQGLLEEEEWERAYESAESSIAAFDMAKKDTDAAKIVEAERLEKERIAKEREATKNKYFELKDIYAASASVALDAIRAMDGLNAKSFFPIPHKESRDFYQKSIEKQKELAQWTSTKGKDKDEVMQMRISILTDAIGLMKKAEKKALEAADLTNRKKIADGREKLKQTLKRQQEQAERMRRLKEQRLRIKRK